MTNPIGEQLVNIMGVTLPVAPYTRGSSRDARPPSKAKVTRNILVARLAMERLMLIVNNFFGTK